MGIHKSPDMCRDFWFRGSMRADGPPDGTSGVPCGRPADQRSSMRYKAMIHKITLIMKRAIDKILPIICFIVVSCQNLMPTPS